MQTTLNQGTNKLFYRINDLEAILGVSKSSIWNWTKKGEFPKRIKLAENTTAWSATDIELWAQSRIDASQKMEASHDKTS